MEDGRAIVNPGSVGQPRDGDPRASYAVYDSDVGTITHHRAEYDLGAPVRPVRILALGGNVLGPPTIGIPHGHPKPQRPARIVVAVLQPPDEP